MSAVESASDRYSTWDAAYVFGSLSAGERREYEAHLQTCAQCRVAVSELSGMPGLLATIELADVDALDGDASPDDAPPRELFDSVAARVTARRRLTRTLTWVASAAAAVLLVLTLAVLVHPAAFGLQRGGDPGTTAQGVAMTEKSPTPINATVTLTGYGWGTRIDMACSYGDWGPRDTPPESLGMVVIGHDGDRAQVATWLGISGATALPSGTTPMQPDQIAAVQLVAADSGKVLLEKQL